MEANKFATMLHRNTNKLTLILIYAVLEWTLIVLLLLNSLFSYLILKFANYFGLKPPCPWCSRIDHFFEPDKNKNLHRDYLCQAHATEISRLGYCSNHQKLAAHQEMCEDCSSSRPDFQRVSKNFTFFPWEKKVDMIESDEVSLKTCSCCGVRLENKVYSPCIVINPIWDDFLEYTHKGNLITEVGDEDLIEEGDNSDRSRSDLENKGGLLCLDLSEEKTEEDCSVSVSTSGLKEFEGFEDDNAGVVLKTEKKEVKDENSDGAVVQLCSREDSSLEILSQHLEFFIDCSGNRLVPIELIDSATEENQIINMVEEDKENNDDHETNFGFEEKVEGTEEVVSVHEKTELPNFIEFESVEIEGTENSRILHGKESYLVGEEVLMSQASQIPSVDIDNDQKIVAADGEERESDGHSVSEEVSHVPSNETEADVSIGTEIPDLDSTDDIQPPDTLSSYSLTHDDPSSSCSDLQETKNHSSKKDVEQEVELKTLSVEVSEQTIKKQLSLISEINEMEEEKFPDTPPSFIGSFHQLHKKLLLLERKESGTEESLDGSIISDFEGGDGTLTVERLTSALRAERKTLHALYCELEEERSASAVATNQTMAMINRLQEEKAAMQMEALQYQRMMDEQSEYDQEALQLLNELMVKREREKQELEKELEMYRKKVFDYESKEKMKMLKRSVNGNSSFSCSNSDDIDGLSVDLNGELKEEDGLLENQENGDYHNTPVDTVLNLEDSLADFEEERVSILEQLKVLEEKLFTLSDEEDNHFEDIRSIEDFYKENGNHLDEGCEETNGVKNGFSKIHPEGRRMIGSKGKRLLPLFDAISGENGDGESNGCENGFHTGKLENDFVRYELESKRVGIEEEVDQLYGRLQALESDREFLKHCISSLKKGDKGMDLLQEILQHLRDLKNVELRVRNFSDGPLV